MSEYNSREHISRVISQAAAQKRRAPYATAAGHALKAAIQHVRERANALGQEEYPDGALAILQRGESVTVKYWIQDREPEDFFDTGHNHVAATVSVRLNMETAVQMRRKYIILEDAQ